MSDFINTLSLFLQVSLQMGTPLLFATVGAILCEKSGNLNLGVEGMMLMGAVFGFQVGLSTGSALLAITAAGLAGAFGALIYAFTTVTLRANQTVTGLALTIFGTGVSGFLGLTLTGKALPDSLLDKVTAFDIPVLCDIPIIGKMLFSQSLYVHAGLIIAIAAYIYIYKTQIGLNLRTVGENPSAADASGINVNLYKYLNILAGGTLCGMGGAYLSLVFVPRWQENITAGSGWIAVALVIFSTWNPAKAIFGAYLFGMLRGIGFKLQNFSLPFFGATVTVSPQILDMIPYIMTIVVLVFITIRKKREDQPPAWLGNPFFREDR